MPAQTILLSLEGDEGLRRLLARLDGAITRAMSGALYREGERIMVASKAQVPVDTGALRASGAVYGPETHGRMIEVTLGYGNTAVGYAVPVHENLTARHPVGNAKYLERPALEAMAGMEARLAAEIAQELGQ